MLDTMLLTVAKVMGVLDTIRSTVMKVITCHVGHHALDFGQGHGDIGHHSLDSGKGHGGVGHNSFDSNEGHGDAGPWSFSCLG